MTSIFDQSTIKHSAESRVWMTKPSTRTSTYPFQRAIIVGASSGMGAALARDLAQHGCRVALVARRADALQAECQRINQQARVELASAYPHDVANTADVPALFQEIVTSLGGLDVIIFAAGILPAVGPKEYPTQDDINVLHINVGGAIAWLNEAAKRFDIAGEGTIVGISSVAGDRGRRPNPVYQASKAALNVYLESLRNRLAVRGVHVVTIKPGYVRTPMLEGQHVPRVLPVPTSEQAARAIMRAVEHGDRVAYVPAYWRWVMAIIKRIPAPLFERLPI